MRSPGDPLTFEARKPPYRVELPKAASDRPSVLAFSHNKAGSTMLYNILRELSPAAGLTFVSIPDELFQRGVALRSVDVRAEISETGLCVGGFRFFPDFPIPILETAQAVLLVRDPRDVLVSLYFSLSQSHVLPSPGSPLAKALLSRREKARATPIDDWVVENHGAVIRSMEGYIAQRFAARPNVAIYRYEDVIFRKREWIEHMLAWYGWDIPSKIIEAVLKKVDVFPTVPDPSKHIRQVHPGNYKTMLRAATQEKLTDSLEPLLTLFGYEPPRPHGNLA